VQRMDDLHWLSRQRSTGRLPTSTALSPQRTDLIKGGANPLRRPVKYSKAADRYGRDRV